MGAGRQERERPEYSVRDADEPKQARRINEILDARMEVRYSSQRLFEMQAAGEISQDARNIGIQVAMKSFIRECLNLLPDDADDIPGNATNPWEAHLGVIEMKGGADVEVNGVDEYLGTQELYVDSRERAVQARHGPGEVSVERSKKTLPKDITWQAYSVLWKYLNAKYDIDVQFDTKEQDEAGGVL